MKFHDLPPGVWDNPLPEEMEEYREFVKAFFADEKEYKKHFIQQAVGEDESQTVRKLSYDCFPQGSGEETGTSWSGSITVDANDGHVDEHMADDTDVVFGKVIVQTIWEGLKLPEEPVVSADVSALHVANPTTAFFKFLNVAVPQGATIQKAVLKLTARDSSNPPETVVKICAEDADTASSPPTNWTVLWEKPRTTNRQSWTITTAGEWVTDTKYDTSDIGCVIQEIVDRSGWVANNNIMIFIDNNMETGFGHCGAFDYYSDPAKVAELHIWYSLMFDETSSGGSAAGGSAALGAHWIHTPDGGLEFDGAVTPGGTFNESVSGGATLNGSASYGIDWQHLMTGGFEFDGEAGGDFYYVPKGGVLLNGVAVQNVDYSTVITGGFEFGDGCYSNGFIYRIAFRKPSGKITNDIDKFPLSVSTILPILHTDGTAYEITAYDGTNETVIAHEVMAYDSTTGRVHLVAKTPLDADSSNDYFLYYGGN